MSLVTGVQTFTMIEIIGPQDAKAHVLQCTRLRYLKGIQHLTDAPTPPTNTHTHTHSVTYEIFQSAPHYASIRAQITYHLR